VGANDGKINDPVYPYLSTGWRGLLVEPQTDVFEERLKQTYGATPGVQLANVALAPKRGTMPLYRVAISDERWATGLSSFVRECVEEHIDNGYIRRKAEAQGVPYPEDRSDIISVVQVPTMPLQELLDTQSEPVPSLDVVCIDTEGYDLEILKMLDLERHSPDVILFESKNLTDAEFAEVLERLRTRGFMLYWENGDTLATKFPYGRVQRSIDYCMKLSRGTWRRAKTAIVT
jgi:FkbM family methyltransferase